MVHLILFDLKLDEVGCASRTGAFAESSKVWNWCCVILEQ
ncbi:hypothetical protein AGR7C_pTi0048 [Agrobacterium deltaense Zutra 3/1]|uniref:Uncharacterized protein n=1 Tax=Agrobacterium deltaense Zutra 3/1 TaxID=1183427 RepID=A0A1S7S550_9HYPH|nr:hypothetical protein AGR7C_pTi0048 [Agrobacterium deltaense Zutra 3/1]